MESFKQEISLLSGIRHENVIRCLGVTLKPKLGMVMEYCVHGSLYHVLNKRIDFGWELFFKMALGTVAGIRRLHDNVPQILHRDLKSLNLLVTGSFDIRVADFGLARHNNSLASNDLKKIEGTFVYIAPELLEGNKYTVLSDVYSLAIIFWEMVNRVITGKYMQPYSENQDLKGSGVVVLFHVANTGTRPSIPPSCPSQIRDLIITCWDLVPFRRMTIQAIESKLRQSYDSFMTTPNNWPQGNLTRSRSTTLQDVCHNIKSDLQMAKSSHRGTSAPKREKSPSSMKELSESDNLPPNPTHEFHANIDTCTDTTSTSPPTNTFHTNYNAHLNSNCSGELDLTHKTHLRGKMPRKSSRSRERSREHSLEKCLERRGKNSDSNEKHSRENSVEGSYSVQCEVRLSEGLPCTCENASHDHLKNSGKTKSCEFFKDHSRTLPLKTPGLDGILVERHRRHSRIASCENNPSRKKKSSPTPSRAGSSSSGLEGGENSPGGDGSVPKKK
eukprot:TRINITY_DN12171_c0_g1_i1.p1 TRINITY_DN12171_c0_g1~~TRINITY_DN12171_c0_g1_i1.p1  ORF type:complete len:501 (-),score=93.53 TRINITY_DN12171_c0_g1_i1:73-1575(-)